VVVWLCCKMALCNIGRYFPYLMEVIDQATRVVAPSHTHHFFTNSEDPKSACKQREMWLFIIGESAVITLFIKVGSL